MAEQWVNLAGDCVPKSLSFDDALYCLQNVSLLFPVSGQDALLCNRSYKYALECRYEKVNASLQGQYGKDYNLAMW